MTFKAVILQDAALRQLLIDKFGENTLTANYFDNLALRDEGIQIFENGQYKSTIVSLGADARVSSKPALQSPTINSAEIATDGLNNPYVSLNFSISRQVLEGAGVVAFRVWRKKVNPASLGQNVQVFAKSDYDMLAKGSTKVGKFSPERKVQFFIDRSLQPEVAKNVNLFELLQRNISQQTPIAFVGNQTSVAPKIPDATAESYDADFIRIGEINYRNFAEQQKLKQTYVIQKDTISLIFDDVRVAYGSAYVYAISAYASNNEESGFSQPISLVLLNLTGIEEPAQLLVKQTRETKTELSGIVEIKDNIKNVYIFRRDAASAAIFELIAVGNPKNGAFYFSDSQLLYGHTYTYRVILENIFGVVSDPKEITFSCTTQGTIEKSRSHNLALPILVASPDTFLGGIKLSIFPNDPRVIYYTLERRDLTLHEKQFSVPGTKQRKFWLSNQFAVLSDSSGSQSTLSSIKASSSSLPTDTSFVKVSQPIEFTDTFLLPDHYYQYRTTGVDVFGNKTSYAFASLASKFTGPLRAPTSLSYQILRETPFRVKINWIDDNAVAYSQAQNETQRKLLDLNLLANNLSTQQVDYLQSLLDRPDLKKLDIAKETAALDLTAKQVTALQNQIVGIEAAKNVFKYTVQRRKAGDVNYETFPLTENSFLVDEIVAADFLPFFSGAIEDNFGVLEDSVPPENPGSIVRPFNVPPFMQSEQIYEYRVAAQSLTGGQSAYSNPLTLLCSTTVSQPSGLTARVLNEKVKPLVVFLDWQVEPYKTQPDHWRIERRLVNTTDDYQVIGNAYITTQYFDRNLQFGKQYQYRVRSIGITGAESGNIETTVQT